MLNFFGLGRSDPAKDDKQKLKADTGPKAPVPSVGPNDKQREMIRLALSGVLRRHGIASQWVSCELLPTHQPDGSDVIQVQLIVRKWHDGLVLHAPEMQREFFNEIHLFDKTVDAAHFPIVWKFAPDCGYPNGKLPEADYWIAKTEPGGGNSAAGVVLPATALVTSPAIKFDLPPSRFDTDDDHDDGFAPTQMRDSP